MINFIMTDYIRFYTEEEHLQHPQAKLIPKTAWKRYFHEIFLTDYLPLMQAQDKELAHCLQQLMVDNPLKSSTPLGEDREIAIWIALLVSHPHLTGKTIRGLAKQFNLSDRFLLGAAFSSKNTQLIESIIDTYDASSLESLLAVYSSRHLYALIDLNTLSFLHYLEGKFSPGILAEIMIMDRNWLVYSATIGNLAVIDYLGEKNSIRLRSWFSVWNYDIYKLAAENGHLLFIEDLERKYPQEIKRMSKKGIPGTITNPHPSVVTHLLRYPSFMVNAVWNEQWKVEVYSFVTNKIKELRDAKTTLKNDYPDVVIDLTNQDEAKLAYYCLSHLVRRKDVALEEQREDILFLLEFPSVLNMLETELTQDSLDSGQQIEVEGRLLLLLNGFASGTLLHNLVSLKSEKQTKLLVGDQTSLIPRPLLPIVNGVPTQLNLTSNYYCPLLNPTGVIQIINDLRAQLKARYEANPARIDLAKLYGGRMAACIVLPLNWADFQALNLSEAYQQKALKTYYQHPEHCAWRYLAKPNPWMHPNAVHVDTDPDNPTERSSTFENYQSLIAMLYLAAKDETTPIEAYKLEERIELFIKELALIVRTHNSEQQGLKRDEKGNALKDDKGLLIMEPYDDLEEDQPACFSKVKHHLFQSMLGCTLLDLLVNKKVEGELYALMRKHFPSKYFSEELTQKNNLEPQKKTGGIFDFFYSNNAVKDAQPKVDNNSNSVWNALFGK